LRSIPPLMDSVQNGSRRDSRPCKQCLLLGGSFRQGEWRVGGTIEAEWPLDRALAIGDRATDGETLAELDAKMAFQAVAVDLPRLWELLGSDATN
jgi:hypothetical protein